MGSFIFNIPCIVDFLNNKDTIPLIIKKHKRKKSLEMGKGLSINTGLQIN